MQQIFIGTHRVPGTWLCIKAKLAGVFTRSLHSRSVEGGEEEKTQQNKTMAESSKGHKSRSRKRKQEADRQGGLSVVEAGLPAELVVSPNLEGEKGRAGLQSGGAPPREE